MFYIKVDDEIQLHLVQEHHHRDLFNLVEDNREFLEVFNGPMDKTLEKVHQRCLSSKEIFASTGSMMTLIQYKGQFVGMITLYARQNASVTGVEIGYWLAEDFTGKGIMTRATRAITDYAFANMDVNRVFLLIATDNPLSYAIPERLGFTMEGVIRQNEYMHGKWIDHRVYAMLKSEWEYPQHPPILSFPIDDNLELRLAEKRHAQVIFAQCDNNREHIGQWLNWIDTTHSADDILNFIEASLRQYGDNDGFQAGIWYKGRFVGMIGYLFWNFGLGHTEIGYWLAEEATGHGIMTRCTQALVDYAFNILKLNRVVIRCAVDNEKSGNVAKRLGFTHEGIQRDAIKLRDGLTGAHVYSLLAKEWKEQ